MSKQRTVVLAAAVGATAVIALGWFLGISPKLEEASAARAQQDTVEAQNAAQESVLASLQEQFAGLPALRAKLADLQAQVTPALDNVDLLDAANASADEAGVTLTRFEAGTPVSTIPTLIEDTAATPVPAAGTETATTDAEAPAADGAASADAPAAVDPTTDVSQTGVSGLIAVPITFTLQGTDAQVTAFAAAMRARTQLFLPSSLVFGEDGDPVLKGFVFVMKDPSTSTPTADTSAQAPEAGTDLN